MEPAYVRSLVLVHGDSAARLAFAKSRFPAAVFLGHDPPLSRVTDQLTAATLGPVKVIVRGDAPPGLVTLCDVVVRVEFDGGWVVEKGVLE